MSNASVPVSKGLNWTAKQVASDESGVTSIEYALIGSLVAVVIVVGVGNLGSALRNLYEFVVEKVVGVI